MAVTTTDMSIRINPNAVSDADRGTARELLCVTESAVDALSLNRSRFGFTDRKQKSDSSFVTVHARNTEDVENLSSDSQSSTASEILKQSTHASAVFSVPPSVAWLPHSAEAARLFRVPVKVLREVPLPRGATLSGSVATSHDNFKEHELQRKAGRPATADQSVSDEAAGRKVDEKVSQDVETMHFRGNELAVNDARTLRNSLSGGVETGDKIMRTELSENGSVHPLMAILDSGYLTQPINTIVPEERLSSGDSRSTSMGTSASPIEVLAKDTETSGFSFFLAVFLSCNPL